MNYAEYAGRDVPGPYFRLGHSLGLPPSHPPAGQGFSPARQVARFQTPPRIINDSISYRLYVFASLHFRFTGSFKMAMSKSANNYNRQNWEDSVRFIDILTLPTSSDAYLVTFVIVTGVTSNEYSLTSVNIPFRHLVPTLTFFPARTDYIDLYPNIDLNHTCAPENISGHFGLLFLRAPYKFQFYFTLLYLSKLRLYL